MTRKLRHDELLQQRLTNQTALTADRHPVSLLLHNIRSLYNVGSLFRTADAGLAAKVYLCGYTPAPPRKEIEKTALGAVNVVPWEYHRSSREVIREMRSRSVTVLAVELTDAGRFVYEIEKKDFPLCLVLGNEITGVDDDVLAECDGAVEIPMYGVKHSLNVSVAGGIALFEAVRQWRKISQTEDKGYSTAI